MALPQLGNLNDGQFWEQRQVIRHHQFGVAPKMKKREIKNWNARASRNQKTIGIRHGSATKGAIAVKRKRP